MDSGFSGTAETRLEELERTCFVIMPFGKKKVGGKQVNFDAIYKEILEPAIGSTKTPEDKKLIAARTDMDTFSSSINQDMFEYIMYSRMACADISGLNPNVFYEIGVRHATQESGTVLLRQTGHPIPFDITSIKIFEYDHQPKERAEKSRGFVSNLLSETLKRNRLDSPVRLALRAQWGGTPASVQGIAASAAERDQVDNRHARTVEMFMRDAEEALRVGDLDLARVCYWAALRLDPLNTIARMRQGLTLKRQGKLYEALEEFTTVTKLTPQYGESWKEKGVVEGQIARKIPVDDRPTWLPDGQTSLQRATMLIPDDFDAWASWGGVLKNVASDNAGALAKYTHASNISDGHPYPLLNALKLEALQTGKLNLKSATSKLKAAEEMRRAQTLTTPPTDTPWCYFDLAELRLYQKDKEDFLGYLKQGIESCTVASQVKTFHDSLNNTLVERKIKFPGLEEGIILLSEAMVKFQKIKKPCEPD